MRKIMKHALAQMPARLDNVRICAPWMIACLRACQRERKGATNLAKSGGKLIVAPGATNIETERTFFVHGFTVVSNPEAFEFFAPIFAGDFSANQH
jgi:hypothetical protein